MLYYDVNNRYPKLEQYTHNNSTGMIDSGNANLSNRMIFAVYKNNFYDIVFFLEEQAF